MEKLILWAQALDNASPDHFRVRGEELAADDAVRRQEAVSAVSKVIKYGARVYESGGVLLTADAIRFVLEVQSTQRDDAGRAAPIVCSGEYGAALGDQLDEAVSIAVEDFARRIGRTLHPRHFELVQAAFSALKKTSRMTRLVRWLATASLGLVLLAIGFWLAQRDW